MQVNTWAVAFDAVDRPDVAVVGGKGASLVELARLGLRVPPGFVVTTRGFRFAVEHFDPSGEIAERIAALSPNDAASVEAVTAPIRRQIEQSVLPATFEEEVTAHYRALSGTGSGDVPVAVRSSATGEDAVDASFAGLQDTYLFVHGIDAVLAKVRACWASLYSVESVCYRLQRSIPEDAAAMAVVVQQMVEARTAGVMFTRSPKTGDRSVVAIEAAWGLGSAVVGGEVTPDSFTVSKVTGDVLRRQISAKHRRHVPDPLRDGVRDEDVPLELQTTPSLDDGELGELLDMARMVEAHYGRAQDVEWAVGSGREPGENLYLLQCRPETAWSQKEVSAVATPKARAFDHVIEALGRR